VAGMSATNDGPDPATATASHEPTTPSEVAPSAPVDPRAVRVTVAATSRMDGDPTVTVSPAPVPIEPLREQLAGVGILGGMPNGRRPAASGPRGQTGTPSEADDASGLPLVDGRPVEARIEWVDGQRAVLVTAAGSGPARRPVLLGPLRARESDGTHVREVVVDGWRIDIELESERRAALRERARRGKEAAGHSGPLEVHAIIPGRIVAVSVATGDAVSAGQQLLVLEAMKMQNELRAPREGTIERVAVAVGVNVEVGDLLMVIT